MLTVTQKYKILMYLGYNPGSIISGNVNYSNQVVSAFNALPDEMEQDVTDLLARLASLETQITNGLKRAGVKRIDDIELNGNEMDALKQSKRETVVQLATIFGLEVRSGSSMGNVCLS